MTCREEVLAAASRVVKRKGGNEFSIKEVLEVMRDSGTRYKESTIRTHITSSMCCDAPVNHAAVFDDFNRIRRGVYAIRNAGPALPGEFRSQPGKPPSVQDLLRCALCNMKRTPEFRSLVRGHIYQLVSIDSKEGRLDILYESGRVHSISLLEMKAMIDELYRVHVLPRKYFRNQANARRVFGSPHWHAPGAAMHALLPRLDPAVHADEHGNLYLGHEGIP